MAGLISTGIWGFICSATMKAGKITATFISGATGWIIKNNGDAEFKSIYARDKIVTNEYVYNRIRVTEDEEVVTSNGKILAAYLNDDGTYNVQLDLREGDLNPFTANDLLQGYYHSPGNTGVIYAVQKMTVVEVLDDQTMNVTCLSESTPYKYMVIVRVGNTEDTDRQSFIRISSRTNCQYFYDEIASFIDLDNPDKVKCAIGKADVGLIPAWAAKVTGSVRRWFGLIADGVILRGTFILKNDKTIEDELNGQITELSGRFEIRESGITGKWQEVIDASISVAESEKSVAIMIGDFQITAEHLTADFSKTVETATTDATGAINTAKESALSSFELTAEGLTTDFSKTVQTATTDATGQITKASETATSSLNRTAEELTDSFEKSFTDANGEITKQIKTQVTQNAQQWKVEVMGADADGNPNSVLAAINADESGVQISGDKIQITGELLASIIKTYGLNVADNFLVDNIGRVMCSNIYTAKEGQRIAITHDGPRIRIYSEENLLLMEICASAFEDGEDNTYIKMHDSKNYNKWIKHTPGGCIINETIADGTTYQTLIGAGYIKLLKNGFERWSQDIR
ncbi:hypothetical protein [Bacteroides cellulosilyticus]|jgi:hypothetical protein|uniref:Uncharacterized protein n=1 Tax=Bacteroides cellulosilyticus TaxID=246787 RepID=A0A5M6A486_9BACE|nr:hypothetical protein [Bacteroides cellulosilyticus]KAA5403159.1 hypothetical protein F2Y86_24715 [Bacteroides cellulosilyticus]RYU12200.1 hypothetical protein EAJ01_24755 [Bacteroides cellulosilyticus]